MNAQLLERLLYPEGDNLELRLVERIPLYQDRKKIFSVQGTGPQSTKLSQYPEIDEDPISANPQHAIGSQDSESRSISQVESMQKTPLDQRPGSVITARIMSLFQPFTMSAVMKVQIQGHEGPLVLKLYDRRLPATSTLREGCRYDGWSEERELKYHEGIQNGDVDELIEKINNNDNNDDDDDDGDEIWPRTEADEEAALWQVCQEQYKSELLAYHTLSALQGRCIPKLFSAVSFQPHATSITDPKIQQYTQIPGLLLSFCNGFTLDQLAQHAPRETWQRICDAAISVINAISDHGILNRDVGPYNCVVQTTASEAGTGAATTYQPFVIDLGNTCVRGLDVSDEQWARRKCTENETAWMGVTMENILREHGGGYMYRHAYRYGCYYGHDREWTLDASKVPDGTYE